MARYGIRLWDFFVTNTKSYFWSLHTLGKLFVTNSRWLLWGLHILGKFKVISSGAAVVRERSIWLLSQNALPLLLLLPYKPPGYNIYYMYLLLYICNVHHVYLYVGWFSYSSTLFACGSILTLIHADIWLSLCVFVNHTLFCLWPQFALSFTNLQSYRVASKSRINISIN